MADSPSNPSDEDPSASRPAPKVGAAPRRGSRKKPNDDPRTDDEKAYDELKGKLGRIKMMKASQSTLDALINKVTRTITPTPNTWVTEWGGKGLGDSVFDLKALLDIGQPFGNTVRWYSRSL